MLNKDGNLNCGKKCAREVQILNQKIIFFFYLRLISGKGCCVLGSFQGNASFPMWFKHLVATIIKVGEPIEKKGGAHVHATNA